MLPSLLTTLLLAAAAAFTPASRTDALSEPHGKTTVGTLDPGREYRLVKRGGPNGDWCKVELGKKQGWVLCKVADARPKEVAPAPAGNARGCATTCDGPPLFPKSPVLTPVDREVLALCPTRPDAAVSKMDLRRFIAAHVSDARLQRALSAAGRPGAREENIDWLTELWTGAGPRNAFTHVYCGDDWEREKLGGLHYLPRYAELERAGRLCFAGAVRRSGPVTGGQYLIRYKGVAPWSCGEKKIGGFSADHDPITMMAAGVRAFVKCCRRGASNDGGVFQASDLGSTRYQIWCGTRDGTYGIDTLYPTNDRATCGE